MSWMRAGGTGGVTSYMTPADLTTTVFPAPSIARTWTR